MLTKKVQHELTNLIVKICCLNVGRQLQYCRHSYRRHRPQDDKAQGLQRWRSRLAPPKSKVAGSGVPITIAMIIMITDTIYYLLSTVYHVLFIKLYLLFINYCLLLTMYCLLFILYCLISIIQLRGASTSCWSTATISPSMRSLWAVHAWRWGLLWLRALYGELAQ